MHGKPKSKFIKIEKISITLMHAKVILMFVRDKKT